MIKDMEDFEVLVVMGDSDILGSSVIRDVMLVPKGTGLGCRESDLDGWVERYRLTFCTDASEVKRALGWRRLR